MTAILFQPTGEVRRAEPGEWVMTPRGEFYLWFLATSQAPYPIYTRHEIPLDLVEKVEKEFKTKT